MNPEIKDQWVQALRSGHYQQGDGCLRDDENHFCCLGVLTDLYVQQFGEQWLPTTNSEYGLADLQPVNGEADRRGVNNITMAHQVKEWAGLSDRDPMIATSDDTKPLSQLNDECCTFEQIADAIEEQL